MVMKARLAVALVLSLALASCKFVPTSEKQQQTSANSSDAADQGFDARVAQLWPAKLLPYVNSKAGNFADVMAAIASNPDAAGAKFGFKEKGGSSPWTLLAKIDGKIVAANTESRAASLDVDVNGDGKADAQVQIGPVIRGTAIRDSLDFVNFNDFTNQIDFAQFGKAFNTYANEHILKQLPRDALPGRTVSVLGAFPLPQGQALPLVTPVQAEIKP